MELEEMKKIWSEQDNEPMYVINESALRNSITRKKNKSIRITNISELLCIVVYIGVGLFLITAEMFVLSAWMIIVGLACLVGRVRRRVGERKFDRSMLGDLEHAVSVANYQVRFSGLMRWNIIPVGVLILYGLWNKDNIAALVGMFMFFAVTFYASGLEHNYYKERRRQIEELRNMLLMPKNVV